MRVIENDGSYLTFEILEPKWTVAETEQRHHDRVAEELTAAGALITESDWVEHELDPAISGERGTFRRLTPACVQKNWVLLTAAQCDRIGASAVGDQRERLGMRRHDGKVEVRRTRRLTYEALADEYGIPSNETAEGPWRELVVAALREQAPKGKVQ